MQGLLVNSLFNLVFFLLCLDSGNSVLSLLFALSKESFGSGLALGQDGGHFLLHVEHAIKRDSLLGQQLRLLLVLRETVQHEAFSNAVEVLHPLANELKNERIRNSLALIETFPDNLAILH